MEAHQARALVDYAVSVGTMTREQANAGLQADGIDPNWPDSPSDPLTVAAPQQPPDAGLPAPDHADVFDRPSSPELYQLPMPQSGEMPLEAVKAAQQLMWQARIPAPLASEMFRLGEKYDANPLDDGALRMLEQQTKAALVQRYGNEADAKVALAHRLVMDVAKVKPEVLDLLDTGLGSDPAFVVQLIEHASRVYARG